MDWPRLIDKGLAETKVEILFITHFKGGLRLVDLMWAFLHDGPSVRVWGRLSGPLDVAPEMSLAYGLLNLISEVMTLRVMAIVLAETIILCLVPEHSRNLHGVGHSQEFFSLIWRNISVLVEFRGDGSGLGYDGSIDRVTFSGPLKAAIRVSL
ncbi:hypothetical protein B296_00035882 [Ensete ventricosum]|uniref:Uncharacterized protein n=1 Tax=Ensete ventricosum TaxID=4639 RepID=A0A427A4G9_ENSVE|nr:hypothetical protein B296_00035882 [Ensete ventricosum]